jgi:ABC-type antimicrobial peptide transport system permease subunit
MEALAVGVLAGLAGVALGMGGSLLAESLAFRLLPDLPFKPAHLVAFPLALVAGAWGLGILAAALGALIPAARAGASDPADALRS